MIKRVEKNNYYLDIAETVLKRGTCLRRNFGAIIVKDDEIIASGYTGAPRSRKNCSDLEFCMREKLGIPKGERYELCRSVHAETNAIISASRAKLMNSVLYLACHDAKTNELFGDISPCSMCKRLIINAGISTVIMRNTKDTYTVVNVNNWIENDDSLTGSFGY